MSETGTWNITNTHLLTFLQYQKCSVSGLTRWPLDTCGYQHVIYVFTWLHQVLAVAYRISDLHFDRQALRCSIGTLSCGMWDLVPWPGIKPRPSALGLQSLSHWTTSGVPLNTLNVAGRDWGQEEKGTTEDEMAGWHHWLDGRESEWTPGVGDGQGGLVCCSSWGCKESDTTEQLNWML